VLGVPILSPGAVVLIAKPSCEMLRVASFFFAGSHVLAPLSLLVVCVGSQSNRKGPPRQEEDLYLVPYVVVRFVWSATRDSNPACNAFEASVSSAGLVAVLPVPTLGIVTAPRRGVLSRTGTGLRRGSQLPERVYPFQPLLVARPGIDPGGATDLQSALGAIPSCRAPSRPHQRQDLREATYPSSAEGVCRQFTIMPRMPLDLPSGSLRNRLKIKGPHRGLYRITSDRRPVLVARTTATRLQNLD